MRMPCDEFRLTRISADDARSRSDIYFALRDLIVQNEENYPNIRKWLDKKVAPGLKTGERVAYVAHVNEIPIASAVVKIGHDAKFCHLKISPTCRDRSIGELFFAIMAMEVRSVARNIHFTLPESLWAEKYDFFKSFTFTEATRAKRQYRLFEEELACRSSFGEVKDAVLKKLPKLARRFSIRGHAMSSSLILSVAERHAARILDGTKTIEVRRRFSDTWSDSKVTICAGSALLGEVNVAEVHFETPVEIWTRFGSQICCSRTEFDEYVAGLSKVYALRLEQPIPYVSRVPLVQLEAISGSNFRSPQSYCSATNDKWSRALAIAALLHGTIQARLPPPPPTQHETSVSAGQLALPL